MLQIYFRKIFDISLIILVEIELKIDIMVNEKIIIELGKKSSSFGGTGGKEFDDLDKIASELGTSKEELLNNDKIKDIHIEKIKVRYGREIIDAIQFFYKVVANEKTYSIEGNKHGENGGKETIISLEAEEYILRISGNSTTRFGGRIGRLNFWTYVPSKKQIKVYGPYGGDNGELFDLPALACVFGRCGCNLDAFGIYEGKVSSNYERDKKQWETKNQELSSLLFPNQPYNFNQLEQEIIRLKFQELAPQVREEKTKFEQLIIAAKEKAGEGSFTPIIDLLLETQKQISEVEQESNDYYRIEGQLIAYQSILQTKLTQEEIQNLLTKQRELLKLEKHLASLQQNQEQVAQIQQNISFKK